MPPAPTLHESLCEALHAVSTHPTAPRTFELLTLATKPFRTHTLFPHAQDPTLPIMRTDYLVMLAETFADYRRLDAADHVPQVTVPVFAIEASLYSLAPSSSRAAQLLYVSKIDSTGLAPAPAPAARLTIAFLAHFLQHHGPRSAGGGGGGGLRIHVFARAAREGQYLFPASAENRPHGTGDGATFAAPSSTASSGHASQLLPAGKRILDDQQLVKWWHTLLSRLHLTLEDPIFKANHSLQAFYILPGFDYEESLQVLPVPSEYKPLWTYGHPYGQVPPPFAPVIQKHAATTSQGDSGDGEGKRQGGGWLLSELIPAFNDDPKARFLHSIGHCSTSPSGEPGDWDDAVVERAPAALENDRARERARINLVHPDEFWHRMGARQECCDGHLSAFFVLCSTPKVPSSSSNLGCSEKKPSLSQPSSAPREEIQSSSSNGVPVSATESAPQENLHSSPSNGAAAPAAHIDPSEETHKHLVGVPRNVWVSLWSKIHNKDYSKLENLSAAYSGWVDDVRSSIQSAILEENQRRDRKVSEKKQKQQKKREQAQEGQDDSEKEKQEEASSSSLLAVDRRPATRRGDEKRAVPARFEHCFSLVRVHNSRLQDRPTARNGTHHNTPDAPAGLNKRAPVHTLQPRKKPKK